MQSHNDFPAGVLPFLPMLYIAWADAELSDSELDVVRSKIGAMNWLSEAEQSQLNSWLDPVNPPSEMVVHGWLREIKHASAEITPQQRYSLASLGQHMADMNDCGKSPLSAEACRALDDVEAALGIAGEEAAAELLGNPLLKPIIESEPPDFDPNVITTYLDAQHPELRTRLRKILSDPAFTYRHFDKNDDFRDHVMHWTQLLADQGLGAIAYAEEYGGLDDIGQYMTVMEILAQHDLSLLIKFGVQFGLFGGSIQRLGTKPHHDKYLRDIGSLEIPGAFAMTEVGHGSNVREIETTATFDRESDQFIINTPNKAARKTYVGNVARHGQLATVFAQLIIDGENYGVNAFVVPMRDKAGNVLPNVSIWDNGLKMGLNGVDNGQVAFDNVPIPRSDMLDRFAAVSAEGEYSSPIKGDSRRFFTMLGTLVGGRVGIGLASNSVSKSALTIALRYANRRRQFGRTNHPETLLIEYPTHQRRLIPLLANAYALDFALKHLNKVYTSAKQDDMREVETLAAGLKAWSSWNMTHTVQEGREATGGQGYIAENRFAALKADSDIFTTFEGDNTVLMQLVAKGRLTEFKQQFEDLSTYGIVRFFAQTAAHQIAGHNPITARNTDEGHLRDLSFLLESLSHREEHLVADVAQAMRRHMKRGKDSYAALLRVQNQLLKLANAYVERVIFEQFVTAVEVIEGERERVILSKLAAVFGLVRLEEDAAWFLADGYITGGKSEAITYQIDKLLHELRFQAVHLVDSFAIPDALLAAPIAMK